MPLRPRRLILAIAAVAAPGILTLAGLAAADRVAAAEAVLAGAGVLALAALVALPLVLDLAALGRRAQALAAAEDEPSPWKWRTPFGGDVAVALARARRRVATARRSLEVRVAGAESVVDRVPEPLLLLDARHRILHANQAAGSLFGTDLAGRELAEIVRHPAVLEAARETLAAAQPRVVDFDLAAPVERALRARIAPLPRWSEADEAIILTLEDLTAIRRAEQMRVDFVANVSHELKTPLTTLLGFIETLRGPARDDEAARDRFLGIMQDQAYRMARLVEDLLSLSRIELEEHNRPGGSAAVSDLLARVAQGLEMAARRRRMTIAVDCAADLPRVAGDPGQLAQVFHNLIENALKYGAPGTPVEVTARPGPVEMGPLRGVAFGRIDGARPGDYLSVAVRDRGDGIPRAHLPRLTERFYRVDSARSREQGGTGLGLAIVKHVVNRHRGLLAIESEVGQGSRFVVTLPVAPDGAGGKV